MSVSTSPPQVRDPAGAARWWVYQRERFPIFAHGSLILAFSFCAVAFSGMLRGVWQMPGLATIAVAFVTCLIFFLQLRIADEFKDYHIDAQHRPYRPVQRGLVSLRELGWVFALGGVVQLLLALVYEPRLVVLLAVTWAYLAAMCKEFGVGPWLTGRPVTYMLSHMLIMPLIDLYATGTDWLAAGAWIPDGLIWFLIASYFNGLVIEIGRKIRSPADEEPGVQTYSALWGRPVAVGAWWLALTLTLTCAVLAAHQIGYAVAIAAILLAALAGAVGLGAWFVRRAKPGQGKLIEHASGLWTLLLYLSLGLLPLLWSAWT